MQTVEIRVTVPEGATVKIIGPEAAGEIAAYSDPVERYWRDYLSDSGRKVYAAAARLEDHRGPGYGFDDLAANLSVTHSTVQSWHRNSGRTAKRWRAETGSPEPIRLEDVEYEWDSRAEGMRSTYRLPPGVAERILDLRAAG